MGGGWDCFMDFFYRFHRVPHGSEPQRAPTMERLSTGRLFLDPFHDIYVTLRACTSNYHGNKLCPQYWSPWQLWHVTLCTLCETGPWFTDFKRIYHKAYNTDAEQLCKTNRRWSLIKILIPSFTYPNQYWSIQNVHYMFELTNGKVLNLHSALEL